jgi:hypothetical protein
MFTEFRTIPTVGRRLWPRVSLRTGPAPSAGKARGHRPRLQFHRSFLFFRFNAFGLEKGLVVRVQGPVIGHAFAYARIELGGLFLIQRRSV